jgi:DNA-3-methyladenine glycosylase II
MPTQRSRAPQKHLRSSDPVLAEIMDKVDAAGSPPRWPPDPTVLDDPNMPTDSYGVLIRAIVSQNISVTASRAIYLRLTTRFGGHTPTPREILDDDPDQMRTAAGLSRAKTTSLRSLADCIVTGQLDLEQLHDLPDKDVVAQLDVVKGIGTWTADMFLMFHLYRPDVLPVGDLALRRAVQKAYGLQGPPGPAELQRVAEPWRPYRTLACLYVWENAHATPRV